MLPADPDTVTLPKHIGVTHRRSRYVHRVCDNWLLVHPFGNVGVVMHTSSTRCVNRFWVVQATPDRWSENAIGDQENRGDDDGHQ